MYNGYRNQIKRPNKDSSESFTSVDSNFEPMLVSSPMENPKGRNSGLHGANNRNSPRAKEMQKSLHSENELTGISLFTNKSKSQTKSKSPNVKSQRLNDNRDGHKEIKNEGLLRNRSESRNSRLRNNYEIKDSRPRSKESNNAIEKDPNLSDRLSTKQSMGKTATYVYNQDSDSSPDSSPVKPQNRSQTLFSQRAMRKIKLSEEKSKQDKAKKSSDERKSSPQRKLSPERKGSPKRPSYDKEERSENEFRKETSKSEENDKRNDIKKCERNRNDEIVNKNDDRQKTERSSKDKYDTERSSKDKYDKEKECEVRTTKVVDLREKLRLKRQLNDPPDLTKQDRSRVRKSSKRKLSAEEKDDNGKRKKQYNESVVKDLKISVEVDTTVSDKEICPKGTLSGTSVSRLREVITDKCDDKIHGMASSDQKEKSRNIISYSENDLLDSKSSKTNSLFKTFEKEKAAKAEIDRLKRLMEGFSNKVSASQKQEQKTQHQTEVIEPSLELTDKLDTIVSSQHERKEIQISTKNATKLDAEVITNPNKPISDNQPSFTEKVENTSENSDTSILYANIGEDTLETSGRSAVSDNFDVEIFRPPEREKDLVSSSSTNVIDKHPSQSSPDGNGKSEPLKDSFEITSTVSEEDNVVSPVEERCETELKENAESKSTSNSDTGKNSGEKLKTLTIDEDKTESVEVHLEENDTVAKGLLQTADSKTCETINGASLEKQSHGLSNPKKVLEKSQISSSLDSEADDMLIENGVCVSRRRKKKKHKKDRKRRKSKLFNGSLSNQSSLEDSENDICDRTEKMTITPERKSGFEKSPALSKQSSTEKQCKTSSRTPKTEKDMSNVYRGVISETVSATTSNVIDNEEVFLSPARPVKSKRRSKGDSKIQKAPVKLGDPEIHETSNAEKVTDFAENGIDDERKTEKSNHDSDMPLDEVNNKNEENHIKGSKSEEESNVILSGTSLSYSSCSDGSFGSNILSEKTSSLSLSSETDNRTESSFSSQTSGSSFTSSSSTPATSASGTSIEESTESDVTALSESQSSCEKLDDENKSDNIEAVTKVVEHDETDTVVAESIPKGNNHNANDIVNAERPSVETVCDKTGGKLSVTKNDATNINDKTKGNSLSPKTENLTYAEDLAVTNNVQICGTEIENYINKQNSNEVTTECVEFQEHSKRRRHHTDGCLIANASFVTKGLHNRAISLDRSLLLQCLLNEITSICDKSQNVKNKTKKKLKNISFSKERPSDNLETSSLLKSDKTELNVKLQATADNDVQTCVQEDLSRKEQDEIYEINEIETSESEIDALDNKTITNESLVVEEKKDDILLEKASRKRDISAEELVFGSWTGLSIAAPKTDIPSSINESNFDETLTEIELNSQSKVLELNSESKVTLEEEKASDGSADEPSGQSSNENLLEESEMETETHVDIVDTSNTNNYNQDTAKTDEPSGQSSDENLLEESEMETESHVDITATSYAKNYNQETTKTSTCTLTTSVPNETITTVSLQSKIDSNHYFEVDEQPDFLNTTTDCVPSLSETSLKSGLNSNSVSAATSNTTVIESESSIYTEDTLSASSVTDMFKTDLSMNSDNNVTFDFVNNLKKSPHKVKMVKRTSPSKLKSNLRLDLTRTNQSNSVKNDQPTYTGYFTSPEKQSINPIKSFSADSVLACILNRNVEKFQNLKSPSKESRIRKTGENQVHVNPINEMKEDVISSVQKEGVKMKQLKKPDKNREQIELLNDDEEGRAEADSNNTKLTVLSVANTDEKKNQKSENDKDKKFQPASEPEHSSKPGNSKEKGKSKSPKKKSNERIVSKHSKQTFDQTDDHKNKKSSVSKSGKEIQKPVLKEKTSSKRTMQAVVDNCNSKKDLKSNGKEKQTSTVPVRRSPRKKCNISSIDTKYLESVSTASSRLSEVGKDRQKGMQNKSMTESNKIISAERGAKTQQQQVANQHISSKEKVDNLQKTPSKAKYVSMFNESESPAKNTRSATKLNAERTSVANTREQSELRIVDKTGKGKLQTSCKKNLAFSRETSRNSDLKSPKEKSDGVQEKLHTQSTSSKEINKLENEIHKQQPNAEVRKPGKNLTGKSKNSINSSEVELLRQNKSDNRAGTVIENRSQNLVSKEISARKSQGYTDLLKTSRKESASLKNGTVRNKQVSELPKSMKSNSSQVPKNNTNMSAKDNKVENHQMKETITVTRTRVSNEIGKTKTEQQHIKTKENNATENQLVVKISEKAKVNEKTENDIKQMEDRQKGTEIRKNYRIPKLKPGQQNEPKASDSIVKTSNLKNQLSKAAERRQIINDKVLPSDESNTFTRKPKQSKSNTSENSYSVRENRKHSSTVKVSDKPTEKSETVGGCFAEILSECDSIIEKQSKRQTARQKSGHGSVTVQDNVKKQRQFVETDNHNKKGDPHMFQTVEAEKTNNSARSDKSESVESYKLYVGSGEKTDKFARMSTDGKLDSEFENDRRKGNTDTNSEYENHEKAKVRQDSLRSNTKTPRKGILDKNHHKAAESADKTYREKYHSRKNFAETHTSESELPRTESDGYSSFDSDSDKETDSDKESDMTDRTPVLNRMLFGSDSSGDESTDIYQCDSPVKIKTIPKHRLHVESTKDIKIDYFRGNSHPNVKEIAKKNNKASNSLKPINNGSSKEIELETDKNARNTDNNVEKDFDIVRSCDESSNTDHIDEQTQCSLLVNVSSESHFRGHKARHFSGIVDCSSNGIQILSSSVATSTSGTLLLDCEDTLDHTDYVDSLLHERSLMSNTSLMSNASKSDQSFHENSSQSIHGTLTEMNDSLEDGEVMSSDNEAVKSSPLKHKRIPEKRGISGLVDKEMGEKVFSPVKFPEIRERENSQKSNPKVKSVKISEVWKECLTGRKDRDCGVESGKVRQSNKDVLERGLKDHRRRKEKSCSHSPRRHTTSDSPIIDHGKFHPRTPKSRNEVSAASRKHSISRSPRPSRRSRSISPRSRNSCRHRSRSPRRRYHRSRSRTLSRERKDTTRCRYKIPGVCLSKSSKHRSPSPTPHRTRHRNSPPRHRNTSPHYRSRSDRRHRSRSPSGSPYFRRRSRRDHEHDHRHSDCDKGSSHKARHCCEMERKETCSSEACKHCSKSDTRSTEQRSKHSSEHRSRHSHKHGERSCQKRKRQSHSCSDSGRSRSRSRSRDKCVHKPKRQRANLSKHYDCNSEENDDSDHHEHK